MSTEAPMIAINVEGWSTVSGSRVGLALDPESKEVYSYYSIGAGTPMPVHLNQHISLGGVPVNAVPESLSEWLEGQKEALEAVLAEYKGTEWDGNNYVGQWSEDAREATYAFSEELSRATNDNSIATYWGASDYFFNACSVEDLLDEIGEQDFDTYCQEQVEEAKSNGAYLELDDVESTLRDAIQDAYNEHQSDIEDYGEGDLTEAQAATAARVLG